MGYSAYLKPRQDAISEEGIEGIIDLANLKDESKTKIEARPDDFFQLTYPTTDVIKVLDEINVRFSSSKNSSGLFLFEGLKGSGKSHLLLMIYHLFKNHQIAREWLNEKDLTGLPCFSWMLITMEKFLIWTGLYLPKILVMTARLKRPI